MNHESLSIQEHELHAYVDGQLDAAREAEVSAYLDSHPEAAARVQTYRQQNEMLHALFDPIADEPVPLSMHPAARHRSFMPLLRYAAVAAWMVMGGAVGWMLHDRADNAQPAYLASLPQQAAIAHVVYTPEVLHPVEVGADQEAHLVKWLSKRLDAKIRAPQLADAGYQLVGGRLLPGTDGPAAQFMYQNERGQRLTLYVRAHVQDHHETAFRFEQEDKVGVFYWVDGPLGYAMSGELAKPELLRVANLVYHQLNP